MHNHAEINVPFAEYPELSKKTTTTTKSPGVAQNVAWPASSLDRNCLFNIRLPGAFNFIFSASSLNKRASVMKSESD